MLNDWPVKRRHFTPDKTALVDASTGNRLNYREFEEKVSSLASYLQQYSLSRGDRVAVLGYNSIFYLTLLYALPRLGAVLVPLNFRLSPKELAGIIEDSSPKLLFYDSELEQLASSAVTSVENLNLVEIEAAEKNLDKFSISRNFSFREKLSHLAPEDPWMILYTGGTTGLPKGAILSYRMVTWNAVNTIISWGLKPDDLVLMPMPFFHTGGLNVLSNPLFYLGGTIVVMKSFEPEFYFEVLEREKATIIFLVPTMFQMLAENVKFNETDLTSVRFCISGGSPCPESLYHRYWERGLVFKQGYGLTEVGPNCFALDDQKIKEKIGSVGKPVFHGTAALVDDQGQEVSPGEVGELIMSGPHVFSGYWNNREATEKAFGNGWFRTGDLARCDRDGFFYIVDRKKDMFISGGENVFPVEIENVLYRHPAVAEAAVVGISHPRWGEVGRAYVSFYDGFSATEDELIEFCRKNLAKYKVPKEVVVKNSLPKSPAGKILKRSLI